MAKGRSSSGGSRPSAPSRGYSSAAAAPARSAPAAPARAAPAAAPVQAASAPAPVAHAPAAAPAAGGMMSGLMGTMMSGMAFGGGSALANRAIDGVMGPRTVVHDHQGGAVDQQQQQQQQSAPVSSQQSAQDAADRGACSTDFSQFNSCMKDNNNNFNSCQFMYDVLAQCRRTAQDNKQWA